MVELYLRILNMSITAGIVAVIIIILRSSLGKVLPRTFSYAMWAIVLYRMLCPVSFSSIFSMLGGIKSGLDAYTSSLKIVSWKGGFDFNTLLGNGMQESAIMAESSHGVSLAPAEGLAPMQMTAVSMSPGYFITVVTSLWFLGVFALLIYNVISYRSLCKAINTSIAFESHQLVNECKKAMGMNRIVEVYQSEKVSSPFICGIFRPRIMLPASVAYASDEQGMEQTRHILLHELYHIKRFDYLIKPIAFLAVLVHWFNPLLWVAFRLFCKDMEISCDEGAVKFLKTGTKEDYAQTLLSLAIRHNEIGKTCALSFGESNVGERVKHIVKYKKTGLAAGITSILIIILFAIGLLSNPTSLMGGLENGKANVLVMCRAENSNTPDTTLLLGYNHERKEVNVTFIPRDLEVLPDDKSDGIAGRKLSGYASANTPEEVMERLQEILGIEIHNYVKLDTGNFRDLVDCLGGVKFNVPIEMVYEDPYQELNINLQKGPQLLDGKKAEMLVRYRKGYPMGDLGRIEVQKAFLGAMIEQKSDIRLGSLKKIYQQMSKGMETDISIAKANKLFNSFRTAETISFVNLPVRIDTDNSLYPLLLDTEAKKELKEKF